MEEAKPRKHIIQDLNQAPVTFLESFPAKIDLFSQVHLIKLSSTYESYKRYQVPKKHLCYAFKLDGELKGSVIGMLNFQNTKLPDQVLKNLKNVFTESLNVLLGQFLTNLEESSSIMATLSAPKDLNDYTVFPEYLEYNDSYDHHFRINYILLFDRLEFNCKLYFQTNTTNISIV